MEFSSLAALRFVEMSAGKFGQIYSENAARRK